MTLHQRERIDHALVLMAESKTQRARRERLRQHKAIATIVMAALFVVGVILMVAMSGIEVGNQEEMFDAHRAHEAIDFPAAGEVEIATK